MGVQIPLLTDACFRARILEKVLSDAGREPSRYGIAQLEGFWAELEDKSDSELARLLDPVLYELRAFITGSQRLAFRGC